jgi:hypothetical protein
MTGDYRLEACSTIGSGALHTGVLAYALTIS